MEDLVLSRELAFNIKKKEFINLIESEIIKFHKRMNDAPYLRYDESYITYTDCLRLVNHKSKVLSQTVASDEHDLELDSEIMDYWLVKEPIKHASIIRHTSDFYAKEIQDSLSYSYNLDVEVVSNVIGLEFRAVYNEGYLLNARLFGATGLGKDITSQMLFLLGEYKESLIDLELCELRGKITLVTKSRDYKNILSEITDKLFNYAYESELLSLVVLVDNILADKTYDLTLHERLESIRDEHGFRTPLFTTNVLSKNDFVKNLDECMLAMDLLTTDYSFRISGIKLYNNCDCSSLCILELGKWRHYAYEGEVVSIRWSNTDTGGTLKPFAVLDSPVKASNGVEIKEVPLFSTANILILDCYIGSTINFMYGEKVGAIPVCKDLRVVLPKELCV